MLLKNFIFNKVFIIVKRKEYYKIILFVGGGWGGPTTDIHPLGLLNT